MATRLDPDTRQMGAQAVGANCDIRGLQEDMLRRINAARATGGQCGDRRMRPALPLAWDPALYAAAAAHSTDMARRNYFDHVSPEGVGVRQRVAAANYPLQAVAENIAAGEATPAAVVRRWLGSPEHCVNLLDEAYTDVAVACVAQPGSQWGTYWTMLLGSRRQDARR